MNTSVQSTSLAQDAASLLKKARRRIHMAIVRVHALAAIENALVLAAGVSVGYWLLRSLSRLLGNSPPIGWPGYVGILVLALLAPLAVQIARAMLRPPSLAETAERLDLATGDHNRIATALDLLEHPQPTPFADAAMADGVEYLRRLQDAAPDVPAAAPRWRRNLGWAGVTILFTLLASLIGVVPPGNFPIGNRPAYAEARSERRAGGPLDETRRPSEQTASRPAPGANPASHTRKEDQAASKPATSQRPETSQGRAGGGSGANTEGSNREENAQGDASETKAGSRSQEPRKSASPKKKPRKDQAIRSQNNRPPEEDQSSISRGSSGGGSVSAVQNTWSQKAEATETDREDDDSDQPVDDSQESNTQRGGIQPSLKDRQAAPSRELGITGEEGPPGAGRGGPSPPKKSRGTASLVLGVPVPDFVKGKMGPGTTKVTRERIEPVPMQENSPAAADAARRSGAESPSAEFHLPPEFATIVRNYLVALHSRDQSTTAGSTTESPQEPGRR